MRARVLPLQVLHRVLRHGFAHDPRRRVRWSHRRVYGGEVQLLLTDPFFVCGTYLYDPPKL